MNLRIALASASFLFLAGAALATPTTGGTPDSGPAPFVTPWDLEPVATPDHGYAFALPTHAQEPTELAVYGPCGCTPMPGCPFPIPWPSPGPTFPFPVPFPFPLPGPCGPCPF